MCFEIRVFITSATPTRPPPPATGLSYVGGSGDGDVEKVGLKTWWPILSVSKSKDGANISSPDEREDWRPSA